MGVGDGVGVGDGGGGGGGGDCTTPGLLPPPPQPAASIAIVETRIWRRATFENIRFIPRFQRLIRITLRRERNALAPMRGAEAGTHHRQHVQPRGFGRSSRLDMLVDRDDRVVGEPAGVGCGIDGSLAGRRAARHFRCSAPGDDDRIVSVGHEPSRPPWPSSPKLGEPKRSGRAGFRFAERPPSNPPHPRPLGLSRDSCVASECGDGADSRRLILLMRRGLSNMKITSISARRFGSMGDEV